MWERVAEDYAPFDVNVTTDVAYDPVNYTGDKNKVGWLLITPTTDKVGARCPHYGSGGVAYVGVFGNSNFFSTYQPAWVTDMSVANIAEAASHEMGHNMGLSHDGTFDGTTTTTYYGGHAAVTGVATSWGPIMGTGYSRNVSQWSKSTEYYNGNQTQDDFSVISARVPYRADDHGNTFGTATAWISGTVDQAGIIERTNDIDTFTFNAGAGTISLNAATYKSASGTWGGNLDILLELYDNSGTLIASHNPADLVNASLSVSVPAGRYYVMLKPSGAGSPLSSTPSGYTVYGTVGQYKITGSFVPETGILLSSPGGGESWVVGASYNITWGSAMGGNVKLELLKAGSLNTTIATSTPNDGSYTWAIPGAQTLGSDYKIRITSVEDPTKTDQSQSNFSITTDPLGEALDTVGLIWTTSGDLPWFSQTTTTQDGIDAAQSGAIGHSQVSSMETTIVGPGTMTFWWKVSSETSYDFLRFYLNGVEQTGSLAKISGNVNWIQKTVTIPSGSNVVKWSYTKDDSAVVGSDTAWVDQVVFTPDAAPEIAVEQPIGTNLTDGVSTVDFGSVNVGSTNQLTFTIKNVGTTDLTSLALSKSGTHSADYTLGALSTTTLAAGTSTTFTVTFAPGAAGTRTAAIQIASNDANENPFDINLTGTGVGPGSLAVVGTEGLASSGNYGGPFSPASLAYTLSNPGNTSINWTTSKTQAWVTLSATGGTLAAGASTTVTASINANANALNAGSYSDTVTFTNTTNSSGNTTRAVSLTVNPIAATVTLGSLNQTYDGTPKPVTVTTSPAGLAHSVTYGGVSTVPTNAGSYAVVATITDPNYSGSASGTLVISYAVSYQGNGNTSGTVPADQAKLQDVNLTLATNSGNLNKTDYSFAGWNTLADGSGTPYAAGATYSVNASLVLYAQWVPGTDGTWVQTTAGPFDWGTALNWSGGTVAAGADRTAYFTPNITAAQVVNLESARTIGNITFTDSSTASNDLTISGANILTLARTSGMPVINVTNRTLTIGSVIAGSNGLKKNGAGRLVFNSGSNNSFTGGLELSAGTVQYDSTTNANAWGSAANIITFTGNATLYNSNSAYTLARGITINNGVTASMTGAFGESTNVTGVVGGSGTLSVSGGSNGWVLTLSNTANTFTGAINIANSSANASLSVASLGSSANTITIGAAGQLGTFTYTGSAALSRSFAMGGTTGAAKIVASGSGALTASSFSVTGAGAKTLTLDGSSSATNQIAGNIVNNVGNTTVTKTGSGTWTLSGTNTYSGNTNLSASGTTGRLVFQGSQALSVNTSIIMTQASSSVQSLRFLDDATGTINFARPISFGGTNTTQNMNIFVGNNHTSNLGSSSGTTTDSTIQVGDITFTSIAADTNTTTINATGANNYRLETGTITLNNLVTRTAGATTVTALNPTTANMTVAAITMASGNTGSINDGVPVLRLTGTSSDNRVTGIISNASDYLTGLPLSLQKQGSGTWSFSGANTYTGTTTVSTGKLFINGDQGLATGDISVAGGATLGGTGTIGGNTTIAATGKLEFDLSTNSASHNKLELATGKALTFSGTSVLTITSASGASTGTYTLLTAPGGITGVAPATLNLPTGWAATVSIVGSDLVLNVSSVGSPAIDHFTISSIASPQTVGTAITGITITAQDAANATVTSFTGTVTFGGTAGITGTSASFVDGVLSGVSVTPTVKGIGLTFTVNDGAGHTGSATFDVQSVFVNWSGGPSATTDSNDDGVANGIAWLLGAADPSVNAATLLPTYASDADYFIYTYRRSDAANNDPATTIAVLYGSTLESWTTAVHDGTDIIITPSNDFYGVGVDKVEVKIKKTLSSSGKLFSRLSLQTN